jgi:predicted kinase
MKIAYIMIGASGSGKSTWIKNNLKPPVTICSADHWFTSWEDDSYEFDPTELTNAHNSCLKHFCQGIEKGEIVVCDNTNTTIPEIAAYVQVALAFGYIVRPIYVERPVDKCIADTLHEVPGVVVDRQRAQAKKLVETWLPYWPPVARVHSRSHG